MHCYEIIPSWKAWLCFNPWFGGRHFSTVGSGVTDGGKGGAPPPWQAKCKKWAPSQRFHELQNMKVLLQVLEIRWSWRFKYWNSSVFSILTVIKWIQNRGCCNGVQYAVHHLERAYCILCVVIIARSCGTLPASAAIIFLLTLECVKQLWIRLCLKTVVYFNLRLDRDLEIRLQRKLGSDTATSFLTLQSQFNKAVWNSPLRLNQRCSFQHLGWRW